MDKKINIKDELKEQAPFLSQKLKETQGGFKVPDGYFESFSDRILQSVKEDGMNGGTVVQLPSSTAFIESKKKKSPFRMIAVAASILLLVVAGLWFVPQNTSTDNQLAELENYSETEVLQYLDENMDDFGFEHLVESGIVSEADVDYHDISQFSDEETDFYLESLTTNYD